MSFRSNVILTLCYFSIIVVDPALGSDLIVKRPVKVLDDQIPTIVSSEKALKSRRHLMQSPGTIIDSTYYDWQRNGGMDDHIVFYNDGVMKINATMMTAYLEDTSDRHMRFYHHDSIGWNMGISDLTVFNARDGFGSMSQLAPGNVVICSHTDNGDGLGIRAYVAIEVFIGIRVFSRIPTDEVAALTWPHVSVNTDGSISLLAEDGIDVFWARAPDHTSLYSEWTNFRDLAPDWIDDDMEWPTIHSGTNGKVGVVIPDYGGAVRLFESTDNGNSFDVEIIAPADTILLPILVIDSTAAKNAYINSDIMYIDDEPHVVWTAGQGVRDGIQPSPFIFDFKTTIFHWSLSTGIDTVVVASTQSADPSRDDYVPTPFNHMSVDWPSIGLAVDGRTLVVAYTAFNPDDIDSTALPPTGYVDIWMTSSSDNGETWTEPQNVTNPDGTILGWDDRYPSIAKINFDNAADPGKDVYMIYQSDDLAGTFVQGTEGALNMDYIKFVGVDLSAVGIGDGGEGGSGAEIPKTFSLSQNYPNPFNPSTTIRYEIPGGSRTVPVKVDVYDIRGRLIRKLVNQEKASGRYQVNWDGRDEQGQPVSSGIYLYRMEINSASVSTKKMVLLK